MCVGGGDWKCRRSVHGRPKQRTQCGGAGPHGAVHAKRSTHTAPSEVRSTTFGLAHECTGPNWKWTEVSGISIRGSCLWPCDAAPADETRCLWWVAMPPEGDGGGGVCLKKWLGHRKPRKARRENLLGSKGRVGHFEPFICCGTLSPRTFGPLWWEPSSQPRSR